MKLASIILVTYAIPIFGVKFCQDEKKVRIISENDVWEPLNNHTATVFFLHGSGGSSEWMRQWITLIQNNRTIRFPHVRVIFPNAGSRSSKYFFGQVRNIWFDRDNSVDCNETENIESMTTSIKQLTELIKDEEQSGIPLEKMIIGGYSSGGQMALHMAYRFFPQMAGTFGFSSFLPHNSIVFQELKEKQYSNLPKAFFTTGFGIESYGTAEHNTTVMKWCMETLRELCQFGVKGELGVFGPHSTVLHKHQLKALWTWVHRLLE